MYTRITLYKIKAYNVVGDYIVKEALKISGK
jgi:hypothetical protein